MRVHLRFTEKDIDLCRWRHSVKSGMLSHYITQIFLAEINEKVAFIPSASSVSVNSKPCEIAWHFVNDEIEEYLMQIPVYKRNRKIKGVIRKHLQAQGALVSGVFEPSEIRTVKMKEQSKPKKQPPKQVDSSPKQTPIENSVVPTDEERDAIMALIAMGSE